MSLTETRLSEPPVWLGTLFDWIVCGVDGTETSLVAVRQVARLVAARRIVELVAVVDEEASTRASAAAEDHRRHREAWRAVVDAQRLHRRAYTRVCCGIPGPTLATVARETRATLVAVGAPPSGRLGGLGLGSVGTHLLHNAPCSVLIARDCDSEDPFPRSLVVGHDGSRNAAGAALVAKELANRFRASLRIVVATGGAPVGIERLAPEEELEWSPLRPTDALIAASNEADLLVVGSRGLRGVRSLGSVSERVGHLARCSVLVVREPPEADAAADDALPDPAC